MPQPAPCRGQGERRQAVGGSRPTKVSGTSCPDAPRRRRREGRRFHAVPAPGPKRPVFRAAHRIAFPGKTQMQWRTNRAWMIGTACRSPPDDGERTFSRGEVRAPLNRRCGCCRQSFGSRRVSDASDFRATQGEFPHIFVFKSFIATFLVALRASSPLSPETEKPRTDFGWPFSRGRRRMQRPATGPMPCPCKIALRPSATL